MAKSTTTTVATTDHVTFTSVWRMFLGMLFHTFSATARGAHGLDAGAEIFEANVIKARNNALPDQEARETMKSYRV